MDALIFDLDDTLVADEVAATTAFLKVCLYAQAHYGIDLPGFQNTIRSVSRHYWHQSPAREYCAKVGISSYEGLWAGFTGGGKYCDVLRQWAPTYRKLCWLSTLQHYKLNDETFALELAEKYMADREELYVLYHDVEPMLKCLKPNFKLGLLTNGAPDAQQRKISGCGLEKYFDAVVISGEVGVGKPDKRIYNWVLWQLHVMPESALMVGDSLKKDVEGAQAVGMEAAWLNRLDEDPDCCITPDYELKNLYDLRRVLESESLVFPSIIPNHGSVPR